MERDVQQRMFRWTELSGARVGHDGMVSSREPLPGHVAPAVTPGCQAEITVRMFGWEPGCSEVVITIPDTSEVGAALEAAPTGAARLYGLLGAWVNAELRDAFGYLSGADREHT